MAADIPVVAAVTELSGAARAELARALVAGGRGKAADWLASAVMRVVRAPEIGCMPSLPEYSLQIDVPAAAYAELAQLDAAEKAAWLTLLEPLLQRLEPAWTVVEIDFGRSV